MSSKSELLREVARDSTLAEQSSYDEFVVNPTTDNEFRSPYNAIRISTVDGDIELVDGMKDTVVLPQAFLRDNEFFKLTIWEIKSGNTTQTLSNIMLLRE